MKNIKFHMRIINIMKMLEFHMRIITIMKILEFFKRIMHKNFAEVADDIHNHVQQYLQKKKSTA